MVSLAQSRITLEDDLQEDCPDQVSLWACLWGTVLTMFVDVERLTIGGTTP